jgi:hypothetical protein
VVESEMEPEGRNRKRGEGKSDVDWSRIGAISCSPVRVSVCHSLCLLVCLFAILFVGLSVCLSFSLSVCLCLYVCLVIFLPSISSFDHIPDHPLSASQIILCPHPRSSNRSPHLVRHIHTSHYFPSSQYKKIQLKERTIK